MCEEKITDIQNALKTAIEMEIKGQVFYKEVAEKYEKGLTKDIFTGLAKDEITHKNAIEKYYSSIKDDKNLPSLKSILSAEPERDRTIFKKSFDELTSALDSGADLVAAYKTGMELEKTGYDYYEKVLGAVEDQKLKDLFQFLLKEENQHYTLLASTYDYLTRPQDAFDDEEKPIFEG